MVIDLETTGLNPRSDEIIEIGTVEIAGGEIGDTLITLVRPTGSIPSAITRLTGIDDNMVADAPPLIAVAAAVRDFIGQAIVVAHNASFDLGFLQVALGELPNPVLDTLELARIILAGAPSYRLGDLAATLEINNSNPHRAGDDARATAEVFLALIKHAQQLDYTYLGRLATLLGGKKTALGRFFNDLRQSATRQFPARRLSGRQLFLAPLPVGLERFNSSARDITLYPYEPGEIAGALEPDGPLAGFFNGYEKRPQQQQVLGAVVAAFEKDHHLVAEAGTGTGKSLAYLLPAVFWATAQGQKVVVATHTINLQEQLWQKDIPLLQQALGRPFKAALVKGRANYLCLRRWAIILEEPENLPDSERVFWGRVFAWLAQTTSGDRSELNLRAEQLEAWNRVAAESDNCLGHECRWCNNFCFVSRCRRQAEEADILVANHSLVLTDLKTPGQVLPVYDYLVVDEAHHLEDEAAQHLGVALTNFQVFRLLRGLWSNTLPGYGLLNRLVARLKFSRLENQLTGKLDKTTELQSAARSAAETLFDYLAAWVANNEAGRFGDRATRRLRLDNDSTAVAVLTTMKDNLVYNLRGLADYLQQISQILEDEEEYRNETRDLTSQASRTREYALNLDLIFSGDQECVTWIEVDRRGNQVAVNLNHVPVVVAPLLAANLFKAKKSIIICSATLTVERKFDHFLERSGLGLLEPDRYTCLEVDSPFSYERQAMLCVPRDLPSPNEVSDEEYAVAVAKILADICQVTGGKTLVLFTSHRMLARVYQLLKEPLTGLGLELLGQIIDGGRSRIIEMFAKQSNAVLLGANSFWEGVDLPGDLLRCVVIVKLPFWPPSMPLVEARVEALARQKLDSFNHFTIPQAILRLKQGFGRLIRTREDRGIVVILDRRIIDKRYGRRFLNSLPVKTHFRGEKSFLIRKVREWLDQE